MTDCHPLMHSSAGFVFPLFFPAKGVAILVEIAYDRHMEQKLPGGRQLPHEE